MVLSDQVISSQGDFCRALQEPAGLVEMGAAVILAGKGDYVARTVLTILSGTQDY
jgi:hypothetical protein